ncbi:MAG: hypothetical protein OXG13_00930 [Gemmatimonadaceae bacterium]|nr:hypothetical protein [Gemmatimonadaceae bacterium]
MTTARMPTESGHIRWPADLETDEYDGWYMGRGRSVKKAVKAAIEGDLETIRACVEAEPELVHCNIRYREPLYFAVGNDHLEVARFLVESGAEITYRSGNRHHQRPIERAEDRGFVEMAELLKGSLEKRHDVLYRPEGEEIAARIWEHDLAAVLEHLDRSPESIRAVDERGNQPIHWAVLVKDVRILRALVERGADLEAQRPDGARPIDLTPGDYFHRGRHGADFLRGVLIGLGAECPVEHAASLGDLELVKECVEADPACAGRLPDYFTWYTSTCLDNAIGTGDAAIVRYLLEHGADPNLRQPGLAPCGSALLNAAGKGDMEIVDLVLEAGGDPNQEVESSGNVCGWAKEHPRLLRRLAERGGKLKDYDDLKGVDPETLRIMFAELPLKYHVDNDDGEGLARRLRQDPGSARRIFPQTIGNRPLMDLCLQADPDLLRDLSPDVVRQLVEDESLDDYSEQALALSDLSRPDWMGITDLHDIAAFGTVEKAERFLAHGAPLEVLDEEYSSTPLGWAAREGRTEMAAFLLERGADPRGSGTFPWAAPLEWARKRGHEVTAAVVERWL